jgi:gliding motility-associated-like protein
MIAVNPIPIADAGPAKTIICGGFPFTASANAQNGTVVWSIVSGTGTFANATIANATYTPSTADIANGSVTLRMTVTGSSLGCGANSASDTIVININSPVPPIADATQNICYAGSPKVINLKTTFGTEVKWYLNSTGGTALDPNTNLVSGTTYYGTQTVSGCESIARTAVYVNLTCALTAVTDNFTPINGYTGGITPSVLNNDLLNGTSVVPSEIILSGVTIPSGFVLNNNGTVTVPPGTATGVYHLTYKICEVANPSNCSQIVANIVVSTTSIVAQNDAFGPLNGVKGETTLSVLNNDYLNSVIVSPLEIDLSGVITPSGLILNANGTITIAPGTPSGIYELKYKIAEKLNPTNTSQAIAAITVGACLDFPINDCDGDGVTNGQELIDATDPSDACSLKYENQTVETLAAWNDTDCDGDGVTNAQEVIDGTDPTDMCAFIFSNSTVSTLAVWNNSDCDGDGVKNGQEVIDATDPSNSCSLNPVHISEETSLAWNNADCDGDGVKNHQEILDGTSPTDLCSFNPNHMTLATTTSWKAADCDGDGVTNGQEILDRTNPADLCLFIKENQTVTTSNLWNNSDCDGDGVTNRKEILDGTDSLDLCSFVLSHQTVLSNQIWNNSDCDGDGVINAREVADKTDPLDPCSLKATNQTVATSDLWDSLDCDGDGVTNGQEIKDKTDVNNYCSSVPANVTLPLSIQFLEDDCDGDGIINSTEIGQNPKSPSNFNGNQTPDYLEVNNSTESKDDLKVFKSLTPNNNGENDVFVISNIDLYPKNTVSIFNRWGVIVYEEEGYGSNDKFFRGYSDGKCSMNIGVELPAGTYFYQIRYSTNEGIEKTSTGYLFLNK